MRLEFYQTGYIEKHLTLWMGLVSIVMLISGTDASLLVASPLDHGMKP